MLGTRKSYMAQDLMSTILLTVCQWNIF